MSDPLKTVDHRGYTVAVSYDEFPSSPREFDNGTKLVLSHRRYDLPNEIDFDFDAFDGWAEVEAHIRSEYEIVGFKWVQGYDHGQLTLRAQDSTALSDPWDSGIAGFIFMDRAGQAEMGTPDERVGDLLTGDVETYDQFGRGEIYEYEVTGPDVDDIERCAGYYDVDDALAEGIAIADWYADRRDETLATETAAADLPIQSTE